MKFPGAFFALILPLIANAAPVDFAREIRPLLSENCFACHGPDANRRKADLRLDQKESAFGKAKSGESAVVPGDVDKSELLRRVTSADGDEVMPPPKEHKKLTPEQVKLLWRWIREGANWTGHWAFQPIKSEELPKIAECGLQVADWNARDGFGDWARNPIDAFILQKLGRAGIKPSPAEEPARLIRRLWLDLTGIPPSISEVDDFVKAASRDPQAAMSDAVDRALASPRFGERLAIPWLDLARYGDTSGYHSDSLRDMWLWREWVINAFNANMPFDEFTIEQIAGDLLPNATIDQQIATGFHRNLMTSDEGGLIEEEYLNLYTVDRVNTTGTTWLGLTVGCAQCHDHKYDPLTQRDFYQVYSFFHNVPENGKDGVRDRNPVPFLRVPSPQQAVDLKQREAEIAAAEKHAQEITRAADEKQAIWENQIAASGHAAEPAGPAGPLVRIPLDADGSGTDFDGKPLTGELKGEATFVEGAVGQSFRVEKNGWIEYGDKFGFEKDQAFTVSAWLRLKPQGGSPFGKMESSASVRGWDLEFHGTRPTFHLINQWPGNAISVQGDRDLPADTFLHFLVTYDGSGKAAGVKMFVNGQPEKSTVRFDSLTETIKTPETFSIGRRGATGPAFTGRVDDFRIYDHALAPGEIAALGGGATFAIAAIPVDKRTPEQKAQIQKFFRETQMPEIAEAEKKLADLRKAKDAFENQIPNTMVMAEMATPRDSFIKIRGAYDRNGDKVSPAVPAFLPQVPPRADGKPLNRLDFAKWLVSKDQPLTARVTMNRFWAMLFGNGIVKTVNDFGSQGEWPSHPELLDWLAADFMKDWNTKRAIKQIVMSETYRQSPRASPQLLERDPENRMVARGPRLRLDAEIIRDNALAIGGILKEKIGGKSIKPEQPPGTWEINEMGGYTYEKSRGDDQYRRGLYVYWRRSTVYPSFITLDAPTREFCTAQRAKTSTPLQSLVLMNDPVFIEAARAFAQRILKEGGADNDSRLKFAWRLALARPPSQIEIAILSKTLEAQIATYSQDAAATASLVKIGDLAKPANVADGELAAWTAIGNVLLNLNETITN